MNFKVKCKVCGEELPEGSDLLKHIIKHSPLLYFDAIPEVSWLATKKKVTKKPVEIEPEEVDEDEEYEEEGSEE